MDVITKALNALGKEPVAINTVVVAGLELAAEIQRHHLTQGVIVAVILALVGLFTRAQVTPNS